MKDEMVCKTAQVVHMADGTPSTIEGQLRGTRLRIGDYREDEDLQVTTLKDYDVILGKAWLEKKNPSLDWKRNVVFLKTQGRTLKLEGVNPRRPGVHQLSAVQMKKVLRHKGKYEHCFLGILREEKERMECEGEPQHYDLKRKVDDILKAFADTMQPLPKGLPPERNVDHKIELPPGHDPPFRATYRMSPLELEELLKGRDGTCWRKATFVPACHRMERQYIS